jgi:hypothetical protein
MRATERPAGEARIAAVQAAHRRCEARNLRLGRLEEQKAAALTARRAAAAGARKRETIAGALERARLRLRSRP